MFHKEYKLIRYMPSSTNFLFQEGKQNNSLSFHLLIIQLPTLECNEYVYTKR